MILKIGADNRKQLFISPTYTYLSYTFMFEESKNSISRNGLTVEQLLTVTGRLIRF